MLDWDNGDISTEKLYKIVVPIFGAAYAAPNKAQQFYTDLSLYQQC